MLDFELFTRVIDEAGPSLVRIDFFNYGEAFLHKRAIEMCEYIKARFPHIYLYTSTNGLAFTEESVARLVHSGIDEVTFSIDGATPESYVKYRQRGDFAKAIRNLRAAARAKRESGRDVPFINWRYILFVHNDSDEEMDEARSMAEELGDRSPVLGADRPSRRMFSRRFVPGSEALATIRHEVWDANNLGNAIPGATPRAEIEVAGACPGCRWSPAAAAPRPINARVTNASSRAFPAQASYGRRLVRLGAQLCGRDGTVINRDYERAWLPATLTGGATTEVPLTFTAPERPGRYALKFDLVQ